jgi:primosomal protein N' (replication factor Y)
VFINVAVPVPSLDLLTYRVPGDQTAPAVGARVVVPLGARIVTGIVVRVGVPAPQGPGNNVKDVRTVLDAGAFVPPDIVALAAWTAEYYASGVGDAIPMLLPPMARGARADAHKTKRVASITAAGLEAMATAAAKQREALELLAGSPEGIATSELAGRGIASGVLARLARQGYVSMRQMRIDRDPFGQFLPPGTTLPIGVGPRVRPRSDLGPTRVRP